MMGPREIKNLRPGDPVWKAMVDALWREYYGLYKEKYQRDPELDELGQPIDQWFLNEISPDINFAQALGQDHLLSGNRSAAFGQGGVTKSFMEIMLGAYNIIPEGQNPEEWIPTDLLMTLGNGPDADNRSNVFEIYKNGIFKFLNAIKIGKWEPGVEGATPENGIIQWTPENGLEEWDTDHWKPVGFQFPDTVTETTENVVFAGKHTHKLEIDGKPITQAISEIIRSINGNNHESYLIENTANVSETVISSWSVIPYSEQVGEFKAVVMVRNKITNTIVTLMSLLSFDYSDEVNVVLQSDLITDTGITLTVGVNGSNILYATVSGMPTVNKRIHLCFERCVLSERESILEADGTLEFNGSAEITAYGELKASGSLEFNGSVDVKAEGLIKASGELSFDGEATISADGHMEAQGSLEFNGTAGFVSLVGELYNRPAVKNPKGLAPADWRVADIDDWMNVINFFGGEAIAGGDLKALEKWTPPNSGATEGSLFKALPEGQRNQIGEFAGVLTKAIFWIK